VQRGVPERRHLKYCHLSSARENHRGPHMFFEIPPPLATVQRITAAVLNCHYFRLSVRPSRTSWETILDVSP